MEATISRLVRPKQKLPPQQLQHELFEKKNIRMLRKHINWTHALPIHLGTGNWKETIF
jgi:hypothetical protein